MSNLSNLKNKTDKELINLDIALTKKNPMFLVSSKSLYIKTKAGELLPLSMNSTQRKLFNYILKARKEKKPLRILLLKYRQGGISTLIEALIYAFTSQQENRNSLIMADQNDKAEHLFEMSKLYQEKLEEIKPYLPPNLKKSNAKALEFEEIHSQILIETARNIDAARAFTYQYVHLCLSPNNVVLVNDNRMKKISEVVKGDKVTTHLGRRAIVQDITKTRTIDVCQDKKLISIKTSGAHCYPIICTPKHKIFVRTKRSTNTNKFGRGEWKEADEIKKGDMLGIPFRRSFLKKEKILTLPSTPKKKVDKKIKCDFDMGYVFGVYLAEGSIGFNKGNPASMQLAMGQGEEHILKMVGEILKPYISSYSIKPRKHSRTVCGYYYGSNFAKFIFNILGKKDTKHISNGLYYYPKDFLRGLLKGYIDGDGYTDDKNNYITITSIRSQMLLQIRELLIALRIGYSSLDFKAKAYRYGRNCKDTWILRIHGATYQKLVSFINNIKIKTTNRQDWRLGRYHCWVKVDEIKNVEQSEYVYDLMLSHKDHSFTLANGVAVHNSESAFFPDLKGVLDALNQTVPDLWDTMVVLETTANGMNEFYTQWMRAVQGKTDWIPLFFGWNEMEEYSRPLQDGQLYPINGINFDADTSAQKFRDEEIEIQKEFNLTQEQLNWRRFCIINKCQGDILRFRIEYPITWQEAFTLSGDMFFDRKGLDKQVESKPIDIGEIFYEDNKYQWRSIPTGRIRLYEKPSSMEQYVVALDASEALGSDEAAGVVLNKRLNKLSASFNGQYSPEELIELGKCLGNYYNNAMIAPENKNYGYMVCQGLFACYGNIYKRIVTRKGAKEPTEELGWNTNSVTRPQMLAQMDEEIKNHSTDLVDKILTNECRTFISKKNKEGKVVKVEAQNGCQDGLVICRAIAGMVRHQYPYTYSSTEKKNKQRMRYNEIIKHKKAGLQYKGKS